MCLLLQYCHYGWAFSYLPLCSPYTHTFSPCSHIHFPAAIKVDILVCIVLYEKILFYFSSARMLIWIPSPWELREIFPKSRRNYKFVAQNCDQWFKTVNFVEKLQIYVRIPLRQNRILSKVHYITYKYIDQKYNIITTYKENIFLKSDTYYAKQGWR